MKKSFQILSLGLISNLLSSCSTSRGLLVEAKNPKDVISNPNAQSVDRITTSINNFGNKIAPYTINEYYTGENFVFSPVSIYICLAMASSITSGVTKDEILNALEIDEETLLKEYPYLHRKLENEFENGLVDLDNSIWLQKDYPFIDNTLNKISSDYFISSFEADFKNEYEKCSEIIKDYIDEKTRGLLKPKLDLDDLTRCVLLNTLYLKDLWLKEEDLIFSDETYKFINENNEEIETKLIISSYEDGQVYKNETYSAFRTYTSNKIKITFVLPNDGNSIKDVFNENTISTLVNKNDYNAVDYENKIEYFTRIYFPKFEAESINLEFKEILKNNFGINELFDKFTSNFSPLIGEDSLENLYASSVTHGAKVIVNEKGIEGGAYTAMIVDTTATEPMETIYSDFIIDRSFGFIISYQGVNLFSGIINNIDVIK